MRGTASGGGRSDRFPVASTCVARDFSQAPRSLAKNPSVELWLLLAWSVSGALLLFTHLLMAWRVLSGPLAVQWRYLGFLVPFLTPIVAWRGGNRLGPLTWLLFLVIYISARMVEV